MHEHYELEPQVRKWEEQGLWIDLGKWRLARDSALECLPTPVAQEDDGSVSVIGPVKTRRL